MKTFCLRVVPCILVVVMLASITVLLFAVQTAPPILSREGQPYSLTVIIDPAKFEFVHKGFDTLMGEEKNTYITDDQVIFTDPLVKKDFWGLVPYIQEVQGNYLYIILNLVMVSGGEQFIFIRIDHYGHVEFANHEELHSWLSVVPSGHNFNEKTFFIK